MRTITELLFQLLPGLYHVYRQRTWQQSHSGRRCGEAGSARSTAQAGHEPVAIVTKLALATRLLWDNLEK